jgi:hypothetical protein
LALFSRLTQNKVIEKDNQTQSETEASKVIPGANPVDIYLNL